MLANSPDTVAAVVGAVVLKGIRYRLVSLEGASLLVPRVTSAEKMIVCRSAEKLGYSFHEFWARIERMNAALEMLPHQEIELGILCPASSTENLDHGAMEYREVGVRQGLIREPIQSSH